MRKIGFNWRQGNWFGLFERALIRGWKRQLQLRLVGCSVHVINVAEVGVVIEAVGSV